MSSSSKARGALPVLATLLLATVGLAAALAWYYDAYVNWNPSIFPFTLVALTLGIAALTLLALWARGERKAIPLAWKTLLSAVAFTGVALVLVSVIINNVIGHEAMAKQASMVAISLAAAQILVLCVLALLPTGKRFGRKWAALAAAGFVAVLLVSVGVTFVLPWYRSQYRAPAPQLPEGQFAPMPALGEVDYTVPADGTIEQVRDLIRAERETGSDKHYTVLIEDGEYNITQIAFDDRDHDTTYRSRDGGATLTGGTRLDPQDFVPWEKNENIKVIDLTKLGLGPGDWGKLYSYGWASAAAKYDNGVGPLPCELYFNDARCTIARYPNDGAFLKTGEVLDGGDTAGARNPRGGTFRLDEKTAARAKNWRGGDIWAFGYFHYDWCDASTRIKSLADGVVTTEQTGVYEYEQDKEYYFFNVLEELDTPGEWYLDRETGLLYLWPMAGDFDSARIELSLNTETLIEGEGARNLSFIGLTVQGTRGGGIRFTGDGITVDHCVIRNLAGDALTLDGYDNTASDNEICFVGQRGINLTGGDAETLTPGNSKAVNNLIHDWPTVEQTWVCGVELRGVGNRCAHNEIYNSPHTAIYFHGNDNVIEYNNIHDVCKLVSDGGAIYGEQHWEYQGLVIRNNAIYDLGGGKFRPVGIYLDDGRSGVTIQGNLIVNARIGIELGGGRDHIVTGNVVVGGEKSVEYDDRARQGALTGGQGNTALGSTSFWYPDPEEPSGIWRSLWESPWKSETWQKAYPALARMTDDPSDPDDPNFIPNPAYSVVTGNVFVGGKTEIAKSVYRFSTVGPNKQYGLWRARSYWTLPGYENIPLEQVGRVGE
ncbi:MAG: right-handed parallel beta-helix repeat-containing protein [Oscillospiraceae bacterium]|nr:right-handed parallel beta-helix repeat-containing protein [Oscillospiraceae bacterium]